MEKALTVPKWVLIIQPKIPPNDPESISPICLPKPKILDFNEKSLHWASVVRAYEIDI